MSNGLDGTTASKEWQEEEIARLTDAWVGSILKLPEYPILCERSGASTWKSVSFNDDVQSKWLKGMFRSRRGGMTFCQRRASFYIFCHPVSLFYFFVFANVLGRPSV